MRPNDKKGVYDMRKSITAALIFVILAVSLCACSAQGRPATATEDKDFQKVFNYLEEGEYLKAQEFFGKNITGNLEKEEAAWEEFYSYKNAVLQDMSSGNLSLDEATSIYEAGIKAGFETYFSDFETQLNAMQNSMVCFDDGINCFNSADYENAYLNLEQVLPQDVNYGEALETIYQIAMETADSESVDELLLSEKCLQLIKNSSENYVVSELEDNGEIKLTQLLHDVSLKSAAMLQADRRTLFAAAQYANAAGYSTHLQTLTEDAQGWAEAMTDELNEYAKLIREWNTLAKEDFEESYYILKETGIVTQGESPSFKTTRDDYIQLVLMGWWGWDTRMAYGIIDELGTARFGISDSATDYIDWVELTSDSWRNTGAWHLPIKVFLDQGSDSPNAIVLYSDGAMDIYSTDLPASYYELQNYDDVLDFISIYNEEFAILTKSGQVHCTSGIWWLDLSGWEGITEITVGTASPAGYSASYAFSADDYIYGLDKNGNIYYTQILTESKSDRIPENGVFVLSEDTVVKIAGSAYLTQTGVLGSVEETLNDWLMENYGNYKFASIAKANPGDGNYQSSDVIAATTMDGEVFIIDLYKARNSLLNL